MDKDAIAAAGLNDSMIHVDFMVGSPDLTITGTKVRRHDGAGLLPMATGHNNDFPLTSPAIRAIIRRNNYIPFIQSS